MNAFVFACLIGIASTAPTTKNIVETAESQQDLSTLVKAVTAANLVDTLSGPGPFTVFAPTDKGFAELPSGVLAKLLQPSNIKELTSVLTYHVVSGYLPAADFGADQNITTVQGGAVDVKVTPEPYPYPAVVTVNQARVMVADVNCTNGIVHIINEVLLPPK